MRSSNVSVFKEQNLQQIISELDGIITVIEEYLDLVKRDEHLSATTRDRSSEKFTREYWGKSGIHYRRELTGNSIKNNYFKFIRDFVDASEYFQKKEREGKSIKGDEDKLNEFRLYKQINRKAERILQLTKNITHRLSVISDKRYNELSDFLRTNNAVIDKLDRELGENMRVDDFVTDLKNALESCKDFRAGIKEKFQPDMSDCTTFLYETLISIENHLTVLWDLEKKYDHLRQFQQIERWILYPGRRDLNLSTIRDYLYDEIDSMLAFKQTILLTYVERHLHFKKSFPIQQVQSSLRNHADDYRFNKINFLLSLTDREKSNLIPVTVILNTVMRYDLDNTTSGLNNIARTLMIESACKELILRAGSGALTKHDLDDYKNFMTKSSLPPSKSQSLLLEFYLAIFSRLDAYIVDKLKLANENKTHPWKMGYFGSTSRLSDGNSKYVVPGTIYKIKKLIDENNNSQHVVRMDDAIAMAESRLRQIGELLRDRSDAEPGFPQAFMRTVNTIIGRGTNESTRQEYERMGKMALI